MLTMTTPYYTLSENMKLSYGYACLSYNTKPAEILYEFYRWKWSLVPLILENADWAW